jgi:hypothetical protein
MGSKLNKKAKPKKTHPAKDPEIESKVQKLLEANLYHPTGHAKERLDLRQVTILEVRYILKKGAREKKKDAFHIRDDWGNEINRWSYAYKNKTLDGRRLRVCVSLDETKSKPLLIVTVIDLLEGEKKE